jgi:hypothetical protein
LTVGAFAGLIIGLVFGQGTGWVPAVNLGAACFVGGGTGAMSILIMALVIFNPRQIGPASFLLIVACCLAVGMLTLLAGYTVTDFSRPYWLIIAWEMGVSIALPLIQFL